MATRSAEGCPNGHKFEGMASSRAQAGMRTSRLKSAVDLAGSTVNFRLPSQEEWLLAPIARAHRYTPGAIRHLRPGAQSVAHRIPLRHRLFSRRRVP